MQQRMRRQCCTRRRFRPARPRPFAEVSCSSPPPDVSCVRAACRAPVLVCSTCDRGQIYCASGCSVLARREAQRAAAQRYQRTRCGRFMHAARTRRWRERQAAVLASLAAAAVAQSVTHQGSQLAPPDAVLATHPPLRSDATGPPTQPCMTPIASSTSTSASTSLLTSAPTLTTTAPVWRCHWCHTPCADSVRLDFLRHSGPPRSVSRRWEPTRGHSP